VLKNSFVVRHGYRRTAKPTTAPSVDGPSHCLTLALPHSLPRPQVRRHPLPPPRPRTRRRPPPPRTSSAASLPPSLSRRWRTIDGGAPFTWRRVEPRPDPPVRHLPLLPSGSLSRLPLSLYGGALPTAARGGADPSSWIRRRWSELHGGALPSAAVRAPRRRAPHGGDGLCSFKRRVRIRW
jgi:hypothetical protein